MTPNPTPVVPRFDWMQATVMEDPEEVYEVLAGLLDGELTPGRGLNGYHRSMAVARDGETLARVLFGGPNGWPNVIASGAATDDVEPALRSAWDRREVTRMDSAQDFDQEGGYDRLRALMVDLHERSRIAKYEIESVKAGVRSRTIYLGSPSSRVRVRLYEKGCFEQQMGNAEASAGWVRLEAQIRPTGQDARQRAAELTAAEAWGFSKWTLELGQLAMGLDVEPVTMQLRRDPDYARAMRALERQYSATLREAVRHEGSWEAVGRLLGVTGS